MARSSDIGGYVNLLAEARDTARDMRHREWAAHALELLRAESAGCILTALVPFCLPGRSVVDVYLKDESTHPTGSLKHRLARSLFLHALCNGDIGPETLVVEASSGSTAVSEAYFARLIGLAFCAVVPSSTSQKKIDLIEQFGGRCRLVGDPTRVVAEAQRLAEDSDGHFMDQFSFAAEATDWRRDNIAEEVFEQMRSETHPTPTWIVVGAGTGGTSTCFARHARYRGLSCQVAVADPEGSAFYDGWRLGDTSVTTDRPSRIEGIGRTRVEPSFFPALVDYVQPVADAASIATMRWVSSRLGRPVGPSTGTNLWATIGLAQTMEAEGASGSIVSVICDDGERYMSTYFNDGWVSDQGIDIAPYSAALASYESTGFLEP